MKNGPAQVLAAAVILMVVFFTYSRRPQIEAKVWHWRYGYSANVGPYIVPVPDGWLVFAEDPDHRNLSMFNTHVKREARTPPSADSVSVSFLPQPVNLNSWESFSRQRLEHDGLEAERLEVYTADEEFICLGGYELGKILKMPGSTILSFDCRSGGSLNLMYQGNRSGIEDFKAIVAQIHKRN